MAEYIEREAAMLEIDAADFVIDNNFEGGATLLYCDDVVDRLSAIPAADVRPVVRGIWEKQDANLVWNDVGIYAAAYKCNRCGELNIAKTNFCPNCGADMREE